jgi:hypothetical protein
MVEETTPGSCLFEVFGVSDAETSIVLLEVELPKIVI